MKELTLQEAALAWAQGKSLEATAENLKDWTPITGIGHKTAISKYSSWVFSKSGFRFRLAPEPPAKRYRPWTPEEVPVGVIIRNKSDSGRYRSMIIGVTDCGHIISPVNQVNQGDMGFGTSEDFLRHQEHSTDGGKTWAPCGVEVES